MKTNLESEIVIVRLWRQVYQNYTLLKKCENQTVEEYGLTTEQFAVLGAIDYFTGPVKVTDLAQWLERSTNSVSMIVDRMVKAGLVRRVRDKGDRRVVNVFITSKGEDAIKPATRTSFGVIRKILLQLSYEDRNALLSLLGTMKYEIIKYLDPGVDIEEVKRKELEQAANVKEWLNEYGLTSTPQAKRQSGEKRKTKKKTG
jgi:MarR family transcriptional regulator, organic hydroperoxide resistance regulator